MGRLILQMNLSLDAFAADNKHKLDWMLPEQDERQIAYLNNLTKGVGQIILGRKMAEESIPYWEKVASDNSDSPETEYAKFFVRTPKTVFTKTVKKMSGTNTRVDNSELSQAVSEMKRSKDDIIVYGGASFVSSLIEDKLIDELNLFFHPVAISEGLKIFNTQTQLKMIASESYDNGIVLKKFEMVQ